MRILCLDCKEHTIRYSLVELDQERIPVAGNIESVGMAGARVQIRSEAKPFQEYEDTILTPRAGVDKIIEILIEQEAISSTEDIEAVAHRVVHGGESFIDATLIDEATLDRIRELRPLAPLHNPAELEGILAAQEALPDIPHVANFDTAFYATMPEYAYVYGLPYELYKRLGVRRYGFHGLSHRYLMFQAAHLLGASHRDVKIVSCHLGRGCSITAVDRGVVQDTSMGFTPTEGLVMNTRCGDLDPGLIPFLKSNERLTSAELLNLFNKFSGLKGLSGISDRMRPILEASQEGNERADTAIDVFCYRVRKYISAYLGVLNGADALVFSAGIGVHSPLIRSKCVEGLQFLGIELDEQKNQEALGQEAVISSDNSATRVFTIPDNEELSMAYQTRKIVLAASPLDKPDF